MLRVASRQRQRQRKRLEPGALHTRRATLPGVHGWLLGLALAAGTARPAPRGAVARLGAPADDALLRRLRGQASDLTVGLVVERGERLEPDLPAQVRAARDLAGAREARAVVWF